MASSEKTAGKLLDRLRQNYIRSRVQQQLIHNGTDPKVAASLVDGISDEEISGYFTKYKVGAAGGGILAWITTFGPLIAQIITQIVQILSGFTPPASEPAPEPKKKEKKAEPEEEEDEDDTEEEEEDEDEDEE